MFQEIYKSIACNSPRIIIPVLTATTDSISMTKVIFKQNSYHTDNGPVLAKMHSHTKTSER
jgi:hypothetical protein